MKRMTPAEIKPGDMQNAYWRAAKVGFEIGYMRVEIEKVGGALKNKLHRLPVGVMNTAEEAQAWVDNVNLGPVVATNGRSPARPPAPRVSVF